MHEATESDLARGKMLFLPEGHPSSEDVDMEGCDGEEDEPMSSEPQDHILDRKDVFPQNRYKKSPEDPILKKINFDFCFNRD